MDKSRKSIVRFVFFRVPVLILLLAMSLAVGAQTRKRVEILHCDKLDHNSRVVANAQRLLGNVNIMVDGAVMWCDSLYAYENNMVDAFDHVHIIRGDTLNMYADFVHYNAEIKLAKARRNVRLIDKQVTLTTDSLDYSMVNDLASYNYSGTVKDSTNVLKSIIGQYFVNEKKAYFKTKVDGYTKDYKIKSDTLIYHTDTKVVYIEGPTYIFNGKDTLYAEYGWYNSLKGTSRLTKKPKLWNDKQRVKADSVYYNKISGEGLAMGHARLQDIENSIIVVGRRVKYNDITKIASASDSAMLVQYSKTDSLFLHADYLKTIPDTTKRSVLEIMDEKSANGSAKTTVTNLPGPKVEYRHYQPIKRAAPLTHVAPRAGTQTQTSTYNSKKDPRLVLAYHRVRFFRPDLQGKCDSLVYWSKDSVIQMFNEPVLWSQKSQISAKYIEMINKAKDPQEIHMKDDAFVISMEDNDSLKFNQIKGRGMTGYIRKNELEKIDVQGNGESNYYARDKNGIIGLNRAQSSSILISLHDGKVKKISFVLSPEGELKPVAELAENDKYLKGFNWQEELKPKTKNDIFLHPVQTAVFKPKPEKKVSTSSNSGKPAPPDSKKPMPPVDKKEKD
jgi:hypothetical protein